MVRRPRKLRRVFDNKWGWSSDRLIQPPMLPIGSRPQLLQARALATQFQLEPSGLRQLVTRLRARDQRVKSGPRRLATSRRQSARAEIPAVARRSPVALPTYVRFEHSAWADETVTSIPAVSRAAPAAPCNTLRTIITCLPSMHFPIAANDHPAHSSRSANTSRRRSDFPSR